MTVVFCQLRRTFEACIKAEIKDNKVAPNKGCKPRIEFPEDATNKLILDVDCITDKRLSEISGKRCDFLVVFEWKNQLLLLPIELKSRNVNVQTVQLQLEGGIKFFEDNCTDQFECFPVIVSKRLGLYSRHELHKRNNEKRKQKGKSAKRVFRMTHVLCQETIFCKEIISQD